MAITYPLSLPAQEPREIAFRRLSQVGLSMSPFTFSQQSYVHSAEMWAVDVSLPPMKRTDAEDWLGFFLALNGKEGYFLLGDLVNTTARGTWSGGSPQVNGAHAAGVKEVGVKNLSAAMTWKAGDWLQLGSGSSARLHKIMQDGTANGSGVGTLDVWPRTRAALTNGQAITIASPKGLFRLATNDQGWTYSVGQIISGIAFSAIEYLTA